MVVVANMSVLAPRYVEPVGDEGDPPDHTTGGDRDLITKGGPDDPYDGLCPPDEVYEGVEGPEYPEDKE